MQIGWLQSPWIEISFSMTSIFVFFKKVLRRNKIQKLAGGSFDLIYRPLGYGPSTLPLRHPALMLFSPDDFCTLNLRIVRLFLLLFKTDGLNYLRIDFVFWWDSVKSRKFYWVIITVNLASGSF